LLAARQLANLFEHALELSDGLCSCGLRPDLPSQEILDVATEYLGKFWENVGTGRL